MRGSIEKTRRQLHTTILEIKTIWNETLLRWPDQNLYSPPWLQWWFLSHRVHSSRGRWGRGTTWLHPPWLDAFAHLINKHNLFWLHGCILTLSLRCFLLSKFSFYFSLIGTAAEYVLYFVSHKLGRASSKKQWFPRESIFCVGCVIPVLVASAWCTRSFLRGSAFELDSGVLLVLAAGVTTAPKCFPLVQPGGCQGNRAALVRIPTNTAATTHKNTHIF